MQPLSRWLFIYGAFLLFAGVAGFLSNPEKAKTALMSGGTFGMLSIVWGVLYGRGITWSRKAAFGTIIFLTIVFSWRAAAGWMAVIEGSSEKLFAASLITLMLTATIIMVCAMWKNKI